MDGTSKTLAFINVLLIVLLALFWYRCNEILMDSNQWLQCHNQQETILQNNDPVRISTQVLQSGSSVWCQGTNNTDRTCHFHHLCFAPATDSFVFFHGPDSIINGVPANRFSPALLDLSSVLDHNTQFFHYQDMPVNGLSHFQEVIMYHGTHFMLNRFNPSNLMHVFHDDLLPIFHTLLLHGFLNLDDLQSTARLVFLEGWQEGEYSDMYRWLSRGRPLLKDDLNIESTDDSLVCFEDAYLGISKETTWYQYGFDAHQGPLPYKQVTAQEIRIFTKAFLRSLKTPVITTGFTPVDTTERKDLVYTTESKDQRPDQSKGHREILQEPDQSPRERQACLFVRDNNRKIINEAGVTSAIAHASGLTTIRISLDDLLDKLFANIDESSPNMDDSNLGTDNGERSPYMENAPPSTEDPYLNMDRYKISLREFLNDIQRCQVVVGMHGSLLALTMFLHPGSIVVELFPYAVNPDHYTPYKTLSNLPNMQIIYKSWRNTKVENSMTHPDGAPEQGGIKHLTEEEQKRIMGSKEVPPHLCCSDPEWLFRIYQDTIVDIPSFRATLSSALKEREADFETTDQSSNANGILGSFETKAVPGVVQDASCDRVYNDENVFGVKLSWQPPNNLKYFKSDDNKYEVWIQETGKDNYKAYILEMTEYTFTEDVDESQHYRVWIRCLVGDKVGQFFYIYAC